MMRFIILVIINYLIITYYYYLHNYHDNLKLVYDINSDINIIMDMTDDFYEFDNFKIYYNIAEKYCKLGNYHDSYIFMGWAFDCIEYSNNTHLVNKLYLLAQNCTNY